MEPFDARYKRLDKHLHLRRQGGDQLFGAIGAMPKRIKSCFYSAVPHIHYHINIKILTLRIQSFGDAFASICLQHILKRGSSQQGYCPKFHLHHMKYVGKVLFGKWLIF